MAQSEDQVESQMEGVEEQISGSHGHLAEVVANMGQSKDQMEIQGQLTSVEQSEDQVESQGQLATVEPREEQMEGHLANVEQTKDQAQGQLANVGQSEGFGQTDDQVQNQLTTVEGQLAAVEGQIPAVERQVESQLTAVKGRVEGHLSAVEGQVESQLSAVEGQVEGQFAAVKAHIEGQLATVEGDVEGQLTAVEGNVADQLAAVEGQVLQGHLANFQQREDQGDGQVTAVEEHIIERHIVVDEHVKNHITEIETQLRQNVEAVQALQQQNQEMRGNLDTSNASVVLLQTELDSRKEELERCKKKYKDQAASQQKELLLCKRELKEQTISSDQMKRKLQETENTLEQVEAELREFLEKREEEEEVPPTKPAVEPRIHNTRSRGNSKTKGVPPKAEKEPEKKKKDFVPSSLRFCRACGAKQLFKIKPEIIKLLLGKKELTSKTCAICGNSVSPPKPVSKGTEPVQSKSESKPKEAELTEKKHQEQPKTPTRAAKKRKLSDSTAMEMLEKLTGNEPLDKSDKENEGDEGLALCDFPVEDSPNVGSSGDGKVQKQDSKLAGKGEDSGAGVEGGDVLLEAVDVQENDDKMEEKATQKEYPRDRKPGRPKKPVKERKKKTERTPSTAPLSADLAPLCKTDDDDGTMFADGRKKENRLMYALLGLDPRVKSWMAPDADPLMPFKCKECPDVNFAHVRPFLKHMIQHTGEAEPMSHPYKCPDCDKTFKQSRVLQQHSMSHNEDRPFKCTFCEAAFKVRSGLWRHVKIHTNPKQHLCNICGQRFQEKRKLQNHEMIHSGELPYKCKHCGEGFRRIESMRRHEKTHTGERPHVCDVCGRTFKERGDIKKHLLLHTGEKPFKCTLCSYRSNRKEYVKLHMKTHGGGTIYKCPHCEMTFSSHLACKKHEKDHFEVQVQRQEAPEDTSKDRVEQPEEVIPTTLIIKQGDHPHQEMLSAVDFLLQFDSANRVFTSTPGQEGTVTYVTQNPATEGGQEPTVAYVTQGEIAEHGQEGMVTYVAQRTTSATGEETVTYVTEAAHPVGDGEATTVAYITEDPNSEGGDQEATITYVTQTQ